MAYGIWHHGVWHIGSIAARSNGVAASAISKQRSLHARNIQQSGMCASACAARSGISIVAVMAWRQHQ